MTLMNNNNLKWMNDLISHTPHSSINSFLHIGEGNEYYLESNLKTTLFSLQRWTYKYETVNGYQTKKPDVSILEKEYKCFFMLSPFVYFGYIVFTTAYQFIRSIIKVVKNK